MSEGQGGDSQSIHHRHDEAPSCLPSDGRQVESATTAPCSDVKEDRQHVHDHIRPESSAAQPDSSERQGGNRIESDKGGHPPKDALISNTAHAQVVNVDPSISTDVQHRQSPVDISAISPSETSLHLTYQIRAQPTVKCELCDCKCRVNSEVYRCSDCMAQICRECVEDKLVKEQSGSHCVPWVWLDAYHEPFKIAYLLRKGTSTGFHATGEWAGEVLVPGREDLVRVKISASVIPKTNQTAEKRKRSSTQESGKEVFTSNDGSRTSVHRSDQGDHKQKDKSLTPAINVHDRTRFLYETLSIPSKRSQLQQLINSVNAGFSPAEAMRTMLESVQAEKRDKTSALSQTIDEDTTKGFRSTGNNSDIKKVAAPEEIIASSASHRAPASTDQLGRTHRSQLPPQTSQPAQQLLSESSRDLNAGTLPQSGHQQNIASPQGRPQQQPVQQQTLQRPHQDPPRPQRESQQQQPTLQQQRDLQEQQNLQQEQGSRRQQNFQQQQEPYDFQQQPFLLEMLDYYRFLRWRQSHHQRYSQQQNQMQQQIQQQFQSQYQDQQQHLPQAQLRPSSPNTFHQPYANSINQRQMQQQNPNVPQQMNQNMYANNARVQAWSRNVVPHQNSNDTSPADHPMADNDGGNN